MNNLAFASMRTAMVDSQLRVNGVNDPAIIAAISAVRREHFVPEGRGAVAYVDEDVAIGSARALMSPMVFGRLLTAAAICPGEHVLIVGAGTGYSAAVIAALGATVVAVECDAGLAATARGTLAADSVESVILVEGDLDGGNAAHGLYDVIFFDGAIETVPADLLAQLADGGRFVAVMVDEAEVGHGTVGVARAGSVGLTEFADLMAPRLPGFARAPTFRF